MTREPSYDGKRISEWFDDALGAKSGSSQEVACSQAFLEMEGNALPFLIRRVNARVSSFDKLYASVMSHMPRGIWEALTAPRTEGYYAGRRGCALRILERIGSAQRFKSYVGDPIRGQSVSLAVPAIRNALRDPDANIRRSAAQAAGFIGPLAAPAVPELMRLAEDVVEPASVLAVQAFGTIGQPASNAVEILTQLATNSLYRGQLQAVEAIGNIGGTARSSSPALASLLSNTNERLRIAAARSIAEIGYTPTGAVPALLEMHRGTNEWASGVAALALWNRDRQNTNLQAAIVSILHSERKNEKNGVVFSLGLLGSNAAPFLPEIKRFAEDPGYEYRSTAKRALRQIQTLSQ